MPYKDPEKRREQVRRWSAANPERRNEISRRWRAANPEKQREATRRWTAANREKMDEYGRCWRAKNPEKMRKYAVAGLERRREYGRKQRGQIEPPTRTKPTTCEVCGRHPVKMPLCEDHDHVTGLFRGWLCNKCNVSLGGLGDSIEGLQRAIEYLKHAANTTTEVKTSG